MVPICAPAACADGSRPLKPLGSMVPGHVFRFHKRSTDGSGKGDTFSTGNAADVVWGAIFDIDPRQRALDTAEGLGHGYEERTTTVFEAGRGSRPTSIGFW